MPRRRESAGDLARWEFSAGVVRIPPEVEAAGEIADAIGLVGGAVVLLSGVVGEVVELG
jgi:hypothetical protein